MLSANKTLGGFYMCQNNCNIVEVENKEKREINSRLTYEDRVLIEEKLRSRNKITITQIANEIGRDKSVISREISRNSYLKWDEKTAKYKKIYSAGRAQGDYENRRKKAGRKSAIAEDKKLKQYIEDRILIDKWSPEEIAGYIKENDIKFKIQPSFQEIYYWIETKQLKIKSEDLTHKYKLKKKEDKTEKAKKGPKHKEKSIHKRPETIDKNEEFGHWELDCVEGNKESKKTYLTILERKTKKYIVIPMKEHTNKCVREAINKLEDKYGKYFKEIFKTMTTDNGHEFLNYDNIERSKYDRRKKRTKVYYTDPYSSWQKGMNENCNGILRRFIPKGTDLNTVSEYKLEIVLEKINGKPRKILNFRPAEELFNIEIDKIKKVA